MSASSADGSGTRSLPDAGVPHALPMASVWSLSPRSRRLQVADDGRSRRPRGRIRKPSNAAPLMINVRQLDELERALDASARAVARARSFARAERASARVVRASGRLARGGVMTRRRDDARVGQRIPPP